MDVPGQNHPLQPGYCANCQAPLSGRYCSACGQRVDAAAHTLGHFIGEAAEVLTHADSRVWRTLWPLLARPGFLTREYFAGRRARYLQPFRLYLIVSVLFFVLSAVLGGGADNGTKVNKPPALQDCEQLKSNLTWLGNPVLPRLKATCRNFIASGGRNLGERLVHNVGRALFVFLPLMAALMKLMYWRPPRYYLEHLLLLIHNHALVFLLLSICMLATRWIRSDGWFALVFLATSWYLERYLYRSMLAVYKQSRLITVVKFCVLGCAYLVCGMATLFVTALISVATY